jgi:DNA helicase-2/ATP-dependent DNA helicase PcrA
MSNSPIHYLQRLNEKQRQAVEATEGYVRVIAGPGSGKTQTLTTRLFYLVEGLGINPSNILCVTFTNKAAKEMQKRVRKLCEKEITLICTYHGFCVYFLRQEINKLYYPSTFNIIDAEDQKQIIKEIFKELKTDWRQYKIKEVKKFIGLQKNLRLYIEKYIVPLNRSEENLSEFLQQELNLPEREKILQKVFLLYLNRQIRNFSLDFDDLIYFTLYILKKEPEVLQKWQERLYYILVDEAQDGSISQFELVELLSGKNHNLFLVGDPDQTIYEWRGAKPEYLVLFDKKYPDCQTILLEQNYRSTPNIVDISNALISNNKKRVPKNMFTLNAEGAIPVHFHGKTEDEENECICNEIKDILKQGATYSDIAILYRASYLSRGLERIFIQKKIAYNIYGGANFFERKEIKDVIAYLKLIAYKDEFSLLRIINFPKRQLGPKYIENLKKAAQQNKMSLWQTLSNLNRLAALNRPEAIEFVNLIKEFETLLNSSERISISNFTQRLLEKSGIIEEYRREEEERIENIQELMKDIEIFEKENEGEEGESNLEYLQKYLSQIALYTDTDQKEDKKEEVKLMTIHAAKGLEFPYVFVYGCTEGIFPSYRSLEERKERALEEERRLAYVALTRAQKKVYITESEGYDYILKSSKYPSRFILEIPENLYRRIGFISRELLEGTEKFIFKKSDSLQEGDTFNHPIWGKGEVHKIDKEGEVYYIFFPQLNNAIRPIHFSYVARSINRDKPF